MVAHDQREQQADPLQRQVDQFESDGDLCAGGVVSTVYASPT